MLYVPFDKLKDLAVAQLNLQKDHSEVLFRTLIDSALNGNQGKVSFSESVQENRAAMIKVVDQWDVRCVKGLIDIFPSIIPKKYLSCQLGVEMDENCKWIVFSL